MLDLKQEFKKNIRVTLWKMRINAKIYIPDSKK